MRQTTYMGHILTETSTTTDTWPSCYGKRYHAMATLWKIDGPRVTKPAGMRPFLTSANDCKAFIRESLPVQS